MTKRCAECDGELDHVVLGQLGHGGTDWYVCSVDSEHDIWGNRFEGGLDL